MLARFLSGPSSAVGALPPYSVGGGAADRLQPTLRRSADWTGWCTPTRRDTSAPAERSTRMAKPLQRLACRRTDILLDAQVPRPVGMRERRLRPRIRREPRRLAGRLRVHAKHRLVEEHLRHRLAKHLAARRAERHHRLTRLDRDRRIGRHARLPPGPNARRMVTPGVAARTPHRYRDAGASGTIWPRQSSDRSASRRTRCRGCRQRIAGQRRLRLGRGDLQGRAGGSRSTPGRDRSATDLARRRHAGPRLPRIDLRARRCAA